MQVPGVFAYPGLRGWKREIIDEHEGPMLKADYFACKTLRLSYCTRLKVFSVADDWYATKVTRTCARWRLSVDV